MKNIFKTFLLWALCAMLASEFTISVAQKNDILNYLPEIRIDSGQATIYKSSVKLLDHEFSGILIIKNMGNRLFRCVFTTETGIKLFDYQIHKNKTKILYGLGPLKIGTIAKHLGENISMLLPVDFTFENYVIEKKVDLQSVQIKIKKNNFIYQMKDNESKITFRMEKNNKTRLSAEYFLQNKASNIPIKINTQSHNFRIQSSYQRIKEY